MNQKQIIAVLKTGIPYTAEQMSQAIYTCLCNDQIADYAYGEDNQGNSLEIHWHDKFEQWQLIYRENGKTTINYDGLYEDSFVFEEPSLLLSLCENLEIIDELDEQLEEVAE